MNAPHIIRLLESALAIRSEYWITDTGDLLNADDAGDYHHQDHVIDVICGIVRTAAGMESVDGDDATTCRVQVGDYLWEMYPEADDPFEEYVKPALVKQFGPAMTDDMLNQISGTAQSDGYDFDAREFAVKWWGWIRVARHEAEMRDFTPAMLKRAGSGFSDILEEEGFFYDGGEDYESVPVSVSIYGKPGRYQTTIGDLERGRMPDRSQSADDEVLQAAARAAVDKMDQQIAPAYYQGKHGA